LCAENRRARRLLATANPDATEDLNELSAQQHRLAGAPRWMENVIIGPDKEPGTFIRAAQTVRHLLHALIDNDETVFSGRQVKGEER
jgi:hypothetical protein